MPNLSRLGCIGKLEFVDLGSLVNWSQQKICIHLLGTDHYFFGGRGMKNPEKNCLQNQKSPNKLFADMKRRK